MFTHSGMSKKAWGEERRTVTIYDLNGHPLYTRRVRCPEYIGPRFLRERCQGIFDNLIVSTAPQAILPSLDALSPYIDRRTTICLNNEGLGLMEMLNERVFTEPAMRPNYVLCHSEHTIRRHSNLKYSLRHLPGKLNLHAVHRDDESPDLDWNTSEALGHQHTRHMIKLLSAAEELDAVTLHWSVFLQRKLPGMIFSSLADTLSVILGCRFDQIRNDRHAMFVWDRMLDETLRIVTSLPEFRLFPKSLESFRETFPGKLRRKLWARGTEYSTWISLVRRGHAVPIDFVNGYFVRRAQELGMNHEYNSQAISLVKARHAGRYKELQLSIPFGLQPYMADLDMIGGGQEWYDPNLDMNLES
ncbi:hypothetical protein F4677DRAFT_408248 [Hypoxylon crocopeplum]|nr:hypothetical protein F4677DRAFT_408248 [Hypoxylon crocopeplum]